jgi:ABC-type multidrug transport system fused ATPase/permease subunit
MGWLVLLRRLGVLTSCRAWASIGKAQADARSMMTGRITDAYTNISTVKLFSHTHREAHFARAAMDEFMAHGLCADAPGEPV